MFFQGLHQAGSDQDSAGMSKQGTGNSGTGKELYQDAENHRIAYCAALTEAGGYCRDTRLIEIIKVLHRGGYHKIGLAFCTGLFKEAQEVVNILEYNGFEVVSIICKKQRNHQRFSGHHR